MSLNRAADKSAVNLIDALGAFQDQCVVALSTGAVTVNAAGAGHSTAFAIPMVWQSLTQEQVLGFTAEIINVYNNALVTLAANGTVLPSPITSAQNDTICATMLADDLFQPITEITKDYSALATPWR